MHCVLWLSQLSSALCWRLLMWVLVRSVQGGVHSQDGQLWAGQRWSDMKQICMDGWGRTHVVAQEDFKLDGSLHFLSFTTAHSEGGLGMGMKGSGSMLLHVRTFGWVSPAGFGHRSYLNLSGLGFRGRGFASADRSPVMLCVIHTIPNSLPLLPDLSCILCMP